MEKPKTMAIRIPTEAYEKLQQMAEHDRRSMTQQAGTIIEAAWLVMQHNPNNQKAITIPAQSGIIGG